MSLTLLLFTKERSSHGKTEAVRCADKSSDQKHVFEREDESSASNIVKVELVIYTTVYTSRSYMWQLMNKTVMHISASLLT